MPIIDLELRDGVFFAREVGYVAAEDARLWVQSVRHHALNSDTPIGLLVDATQATTICNDARKLFAQASDTPNVAVAAVAVNVDNMRGAQHSRITALLASIRKTHETHFFDTIEEAQEFIAAYRGAAATR